MMYQVRLINPDLGLDQTLTVPDGEYILDIAEVQGLRLPAGCKQGDCSVCIAKIVAGEVDQSEQKLLKTEEITQGYTVTCVAYPLSDCTLLTHQEKILYQSAMYFQENKG